MFGKKAKELQAEIERINSENASLKNRISELEAELTKMKDRESDVVRAITEAGKTAARIEEDANEKRSALIANAEMIVRTASENAEAITARAAEESDEVRKAAEDYKQHTRSEADEYSDRIRKDADDYSENTRTDVNIYVERTIMASQSEIRKRKEVTADLNTMLKNAVAYITEQNNSYIELLKTIIDENESQQETIVGDIDKCSCSCENCENPCSDKKAENAVSPAAAPAAAAGEAEAALPESYDDPAHLMQNIYHILKRQLPDNVSELAGKEAPEAKPVPVAEPEKAPEEIPEIGSELPHDSDLSSLVSEVLN